MKSRSVQHLGSINVQDEYGTPKKLFQNICKKYDVYPKIDICASNTNHVVPDYITKEQNCLNYNIAQDFFMNPPYSRVSEFIEFACSQHVKNNISCIILTYSKTGTRWWHKYVQNIADHVDFQKGRIRFLDEDGNKTEYCAPYDSVWIVFKKKPSANYKKEYNMSCKT